MVEASFEDAGKRYWIEIVSQSGQDCSCGARDWTVDDPVLVLDTWPAPTAQDPKREGHLQVAVRILCKACGKRSRREVLTTRVSGSKPNRG